MESLLRHIFDLKFDSALGHLDVLPTIVIGMVLGKPRIETSWGGNEPITKVLSRFDSNPALNDWELNHYCSVRFAGANDEGIMTRFHFHRWIAEILKIDAFTL